MSDAVVEMRPNPTAKQELHAIQLQVIKEVFELDIKPDAVKNSPVTQAGLQRNIAKHRKRPGGTGTNRRSIDVEVKNTPKGVVATIFTQSGYGGYLEVGTSKMRAQPYIYPAVKRFMSKIGSLVKSRTRGK